MTDYIKREDAIRHGKWIDIKFDGYVIEDAKTADAVAVVRCKDCKYNDADEKIRERFCPDPTGRFMLLNGFCSCGERNSHEKVH